MSSDNTHLHDLLRPVVELEMIVTTNHMLAILVANALPFNTQR